MAGPHTARARARALMLEEIKRHAIDQLVVEGAAQLSLRAIARDLGLVSSAIYRYFPSRDHLLTALIIDAYAEFAAAIDAADRRQPRSHYRRRWLARCTRMRGWAVEQPARFQLLYGSPVPGYRAPSETIAPAAAVISAIFGVLAEASAADQLSALSPARPAGLRTQLAVVADALDLSLPSGTLAWSTAAFAQLVGMISLELGGHFVGGFEPADALFRHTVEQLCDQVGLR